MSDEIHLVDLMYPSEESRRAHTERGSKLSKLPQDYVTNLELEQLARLICPEYAQNALKVFTELSTDPETLNYRLDILEDFLNVPALEAVLYENVHKLYINEHVNVRKLGLLSASQAATNSCRKIAINSAPRLLRVLAITSPRSMNPTILKR